MSIHSWSTPGSVPCRPKEAVSKITLPTFVAQNLMRVSHWGGPDPVDMMKKSCLAKYDLYLLYTALPAGAGKLVKSRPAVDIERFYATRRLAGNQN